MNLETQLKDVLRRVDPPDGFRDRVLERLSPNTRKFPRALAAAALIAAMLGGWGVHTTLRARSELLTAMRIASHQVAHVQQEIRK